MLDLGRKVFQKQLDLTEESQSHNMSEIEIVWEIHGTRLPETEISYDFSKGPYHRTDWVKV